LGAMIPATVHWGFLRRENRRRERVNGYGEERVGEMDENSKNFTFAL